MLTALRGVFLHVCRFLVVSPELPDKKFTYFIPNWGTTKQESFRTGQALKVTLIYIYLKTKRTKGISGQAGHENPGLQNFVNYIPKTNH